MCSRITLPPNDYQSRNMNKWNLSNIFSAIVIVVVQVFLLKNIQLVVLDKYVVSAFIYPLIIIAFPFSTPRPVVLTMAFFIGLIVDIAYDSIGLHTSAIVITAFLRSFVLILLQPRGGYGDKSIGLYSYGSIWYLRYTAILMAIHVFLYFSLDAFTFVFLWKIFVNTLLSFAVSYVMLLLYSMIFRT